MDRTRLVCLLAGLFIFGSIFFPPSARATAQLSPSSINFGSVPMDAASATATITVSHTANATMLVDQVTSSLPEFVITTGKLPITVLANGSTTFQVTFRPDSAATFNGTITVTITGTNGLGTMTLPVSGSGAAATQQPLLTLVPSGASFGNVAVGVTNSQTMTIQNSGTANLTLTQATLAGSSYALSGLTLPLSIAAGGSAAFNISFDPTSAGSYPGSLKLVSNATGSPTSIALSGTGIAKALTLSASSSSLNFGSLTTGTSASRPVTVTNTGNSTVTISQIATSGASFSTSVVSLPVSLAAGQSTSFSVTCAPAAGGNLTGSVTISSNATNSPLAIALTGTATAASTYSVNLSWTPSSSSYEGFNLYRGSASGGPYTKIDTSLIPSPSYADSGVTAGKTYYYVVTEVDSAGTESAYSGEVSAAIP